MATYLKNRKAPGSPVPLTIVRRQTAGASREPEPRGAWPWPGTTRPWDVVHDDVNPWL